MQKFCCKFVSYIVAEILRQYRTKSPDALNIIQIAEIALQLLRRYAIIEKMEQEEFI